MPKLSKKQLTAGTVGGTGASAKGASTARPAGVTPGLANFHPISGFAAAAPKPKAGKKPNTHPIQRR
jgi:hypothetical protein